MLRKIVYAGVNFPSFQCGSQALTQMAELQVPPKQVERLTRRIGEERVAQRNQEIKNYLDLPLSEKCSSPASAAVIPDLAVVQIDGGRLQILDRRGVEDQQPARDGSNPHSNPSTAQTEVTAAPPAAWESESHSRHWREDKVGVLITMSSEASLSDPCPRIPEHFVDPLRILKLAREIKPEIPVPEDAVADADSEASELEPSGLLTNEESRGEGEWQPPRRLVQTTVATRGSSQEFGPLMAQAAWARGFKTARRQAFVSDGASMNKTLKAKWFSEYTGILDFIHVLSYIFAAAMGGRKFKEGWAIYVAWIEEVWRGQAEKVIEELRERLDELGAAEAEESETSPRAMMAKALSYLENNKDWMRYDEYRRQGLPITSSHVESTIKRINQRVKGTEKLWSEEGAEAILQLRGDYLSETEPMEKFWRQRQAAATGRRGYRRSG